MANENIKDVVRTKYGEAARRVRRQERRAVADAGRARLNAAIQSRRIYMQRAKWRNCRRRWWRLLSGAGIPRHWRS